MAVDDELVLARDWLGTGGFAPANPYIGVRGAGTGLICDGRVYHGKPLHGFLVSGFSTGTDALQSIPTNGPVDAMPRVPTARSPHSVATIIGGIKGDATRRIRRLCGQPDLVVWQERYYDRIVRNEQEFDTILRYIETNPANWASDRYSR